MVCSVEIGLRYKTHVCGTPLYTQLKGLSLRDKPALLSRKRLSSAGELLSIFRCIDMCPISNERDIDLIDSKLTTNSLVKKS